MTTRRDFMRYLGATAAAGALPARALPAGAHAPRLGFAPLAHGADPHHHLPQGYQAQVLLRWGDVVSGTEAPFDPKALDAAAQRRRFGYNNDFIAFCPLPRGGGDPGHGLLCVNHEYTNPTFMWPGLNRLNLGRAMTRERTAVDMAAIGHSVVEIERRGRTWVRIDGHYNRRLHADSPLRIAGPAAGHARLRTSADAEAGEARGIVNACSGGKTPWGTVLIAEENFHIVFGGVTGDQCEARNHARYGVGQRNAYPWWARHHPRFDVAREPREANRFGWVVELDPYDPEAMPVKRTALGRFKHEASTCVLNPDGRVVIYSGDDEPFEYLYRFVSSGRFDPRDRSANADLLDHGELSVARFHDDGRLEWIPLLAGHGPLTPDNGFTDQADVLIEARRAADLVGATHLDRPEDVEASPRDGIVYASFTNNRARTADRLDAANPRAHNVFGHMLRLLPPGAPGDRVEHAAASFRWSHFVLAGDPDNPAHNARYAGHTGDSGWFASPDNCAFDPDGRLWIATDQGRAWRDTGFADGLWAYAANADGEAEFRRFFRAPLGAEVCGPEFTPDGRTLFLSVQHPGVDGVLAGGYDDPVTRWPDFDDDLPPRPAVIAITRDDGGVIGA